MRGNFILAYKRLTKWVNKALAKARFTLKHLPTKKAARTATVLTPASSVITEKKRKVKTVKCRNCEQKTIVDESGCCQWCGYPLSAKLYEEHKEHEEKVKEPKELKPVKEKPIVIRTPFTLTCVGCLVVVALAILLLVGASYGLVMTEALDTVLGGNDTYLQIKAIVNPPKPKVVSKHAYVTGLGQDYTIVVKSMIANNGGSGDVVVHMQLTTPEKSREKSTTVYLKSGQTKPVDIDFPEVSTPWLQMFIKALFGDIGGAYEELIHPDIDYDVWAERAR